jgi:hypothetical protein
MELELLCLSVGPGPGVVARLWCFGYVDLTDRPPPGRAQPHADRQATWASDRGAHLTFAGTLCFYELC